MSEKLSVFVREWRARAGISAAEAARRLGMSLRTLEGIEQGRQFRNDTLLRMAIKYLESANGNAS